MSNPSIVAIVGSLRKGSLNLQLAQQAQALCAGKADFEILDISKIPMMNEDIEYPAPAAVAALRSKVQQADGVWFFTPEYNHYFSGVLKNTLDWLSRPASKGEKQVLLGKPTAISGIAPSMMGTGIAQDHLVALLTFINARVMNSPRLRIPNANEQVVDGVLQLTQSLQFLQEQLDAFLPFIEANKQ